MKIMSINEYMNTSNVMYRNDNYNNSGIIDIKDIICFETGELHNIDIFEYCIDNYELSDKLIDMINNIIENIDDYEKDDDELCLCVDMLIDEISKCMHKKIKYGLWLADRQNVIDFYNGDDNNINAYIKSDVILSDIGPDGILFGYDKKPIQIKKDR